jgi:UPF0271 protein
VLDSSAFIIGFNPLSVNEVTYSVPQVADELSTSSIAYIRFETSCKSRKLILREPSQASINRISSASIELGDWVILSRTDIQVLALALDLKLERLHPIIVSDDYSIQNVAESLGITYAALATFGISHRFNWIEYCPACFRKYSQNHAQKVCEVCGTPLKRKALRKTLALRKST